jgi:hypothetical protein
MHFATHGDRLGQLLERHDNLHERLTALDERPHDAAEHEAISDDIRANVTAIYELVGLPGIRGLIHVAHEALDTAAHLGLPLDPGGEFKRPEDSEAYMAIMSDTTEISTLIQLLAVYEGKLPADAH